ncbi:alginate biosynthesis protein [Acinetobacter seohaensis]|uniref:sensor histidine kinase n=1 Tax=Acinetobacter towneri TaxID=202956 RepID=UPI001B83533C|nr:histidine kinase [Acinetobacter towneri]MDV2483966.1 histidine kinase [Acinetobacter towneri]GIT83386.1 alginate biosynthesis protein [Acinetobacter seohaensis]
MWSYRLNKVKSGDLDKSITNSDSLAEEQANQTYADTQAEQNYVYFFTKIGRWQYLIELFIGSNALAMVLALAEAQGWQGLSFTRVLQYILYINWVVLCFAALVEFFQARFLRMGLALSFMVSFILLQTIVLVTTLSLNTLLHFGQNFHLQQFSLAELMHGIGLHLSYGVILGAFCFRYIYVREQATQQRHSELQARVHAMQARIHPHFLFNSLNNVISLIAIDPDKAEQMLLNLSRLFRASLQELKLVSLKDEIELCQRYLEIEQIRLGDRLAVEWKIEQPQLLSQVQIPLLTLQPLLENSIFHGVEKVLAKSTISILIEILQNQVNIVITNPYVSDKINLRQGHGIALQNVEQRLKAYYGRSVTFKNYAGNGMYTTVLQYRYK